MEKILSLFETYPLEYDAGEIITAFLLFLFIAFTLYTLSKIKIKLPVTIIRRKKRREINLSNSKETAYRITFLIREYETPYNEELLKKLEKYKYRKEVENFDAETIKLIKKFLEYIK